MPSTYSPLIRTELIATGDQAGNWGITTNGNIGTFLEAAIAGTATIALPAGAADYTLTAYNGVADEARNATLKITAVLTANRNVIVPALTKHYLVYNATTGAYTVTVKTAAGTGIGVPQGAYMWLYVDGTNVVNVSDGDVAKVIHAATSKATPVDADELALVDSAASNVLKKLTWANLKATFYAALGGLIAAGTAKATPVDADSIAISDSAAGGATKTTTWANIKATFYAALGGLIAGGTGKTTPVNADTIAIADSAASNATKTLTWANLTATILTYLGTVTLLTKVITETKTAPAISAGALTLDLTAGSVFDVALNGAITTLTISNPPASGTPIGFTLIFTADGTPRAVTWPASVKWAGGTAPTLTSTNGKQDIFTFVTRDAGTSYLGFVSGQNL